MIAPTATTTHQPIPQPAGHALIGNLLDIDGSGPVQSMLKLAQQHGPIFSLELPGRKVILVSGYELVNELCDEQRFDKMVHAPLRNVRAFAGDGLFTAETHEPNWHKAHNILLPNFGMKAMQGYMPMMIDIAEQLMLKWERLNPGDVIDVPDDMTRLTLDTIGLCGFNYRFNSFYREEPHPFIGALVRALSESMNQLRRLPVQDALMIRQHRQFQADIALMNDLVDQIIRERKASGSNATQADLLSYMLNGVDKASGEGLDDTNIRHQIITFLIAGHETTSGLLSFALYFLLQHPEVLAKARAEVDRVLGADPAARPTYAQVQRLTYVQQILKEALRLWPTAPIFALYPREDTTLAGTYDLPRGQQLSVLIPMLHRDTSVWGADAEEFNPDRFAPERERELPPNAYKPFGNGQRACIGRQFAMQEAVLVLGMLLQRFELIDHAGYQLRIKESLTLKPEGFTIKVRPRVKDESGRMKDGKTSVTQAPIATDTNPTSSFIAHPSSFHGTPLLVLYGSNLGTAEDLARQLAEEASSRGFNASSAPLDEHAGKLPREGALIVVSASYNGLPPDNAAAFCDWLRGGALAADALSGLRYTVFGCGHHDWATTYQAVPTLIDERLAVFGAQRIYARGAGDAGDDFDGQLSAWKHGLWPALGAAFGLEFGAAQAHAKGPLYTIELAEAQSAHPFVAAFGAQPMRVLANRELQQNGSDRSTRHLELALPDGVAYHTGDHLGVLPRNRAEQVGRVLRRFALDGESQIVIRRTAGGKSHLPLNQPISLTELLSTYTELQDVATRAQIRLLAEHTECPPHKMQLLALADEATSLYREQIFAKHVAVLDLLERYAACELPFNLFLEMLPPLRPRYYSISSSPLASEQACSLTIAVVAGQAQSGQGTYRGVASNYLAEQAPGSLIYGFVRSPNAPFQPPATPATPLIMVGPGTGLAPFRGFLQERAALHSQGATLGEALLFFGCRNPQHDLIYEDELRAYESQGLVELQVAYSRIPGQPKTYVQHQIAAQAEKVWQLIEAGAVVYVCGDAAKMAPDVRAALAAIYQAKTGASAEAAESWLGDLAAQGRYLTDVWASG